MTGICGVVVITVISGCGSLTGSTSERSSSSSAGRSADDTMTMGDASFLDVALAAVDESAGSDDVAGPGESTAPGDRRPRMRHQVRARRFFRGVHGEATVRTREGFARVAWQRGQVTAVSGTGLTVRSADGVTWRWVTNQNTKIRKRGAKAALSRLAANDWVFVIGTVNGSTRTARAAVVPKRVPRNAPAPSPTAS